MWGETLLAQQKPQEALEKFDHVLAMDAARWSRGEIKPAQREPAVDAAMARGQALIAMKKTDDALTAYRQAVGILESQRPSASRIKAGTSFGMLGKLLAQKGDTKAATENLQQAIKIEPKLAFPHYEMGQILASQGKKPEAAVEFANAMAAQPAYIEPRLALGRLMLSVDNLGGAQQQFVAAARINPYYPGVREAAEAFDAAVKKATTRAATRAATMRAATQSAATRAITQGPTTQPSR
jgi:tetratricopeptide (TPR) repeat protein